VTRVVISAHANDDLAEILQYLTADAGPRVALDYRERFRAFYRLLSDHPEIGRPVRDWADPFASASLIPILPSIATTATP
jgi:plasmid stabilization system protein ParE